MNLLVSLSVVAAFLLRDSLIFAVVGRRQAPGN